jgi:hypothetical protein
MAKSDTKSAAGRTLRILAVLFIILILGITSLPFAGVTVPALDSTPTPDLSAQGVAQGFPTVPPGGTSVTAAYTHFHPTGIISMPKLVNWDLPGEGAEETALSPNNTGFGRVGLMFINSVAQSVVHGFIERDATRPVTSIQDLDSRYDNDYLNAAWKDYTGGWRETGRRIEIDTSIIDLELTLTQEGPDGSRTTFVYAARQISRLDQEWTVTLRLVAPNNNTALLDQLQQSVWSQFAVWRVMLDGQASWPAIADYAAGYLLKYPTGWRRIEGAPGRPYVVVGEVGSGLMTLTTRLVPGAAPQTEADARAWLAENTPRATVNRVVAETLNGTPGFSLSYADPDPDGNQRSAVTTLLNGPDGSTFVLTQQWTVRGIDLLDVTNVIVPPDLLRIRASFFALPRAELAATATPIPTATPLQTPTPG